MCRGTESTRRHHVKRPLVLTILAILAIIGGVLSLLGALFGLLGTGLAASGALAGYGAAAPSAAFLAYSTVSAVVFGILFLAFGIGTFMSKGWAWTAGVIALVLEILSYLASLVINGFGAGAIVGAVIGILISLLVLWYLFRPNVRAAYAK
jgi:hypothetical protein